MSFQPCDSCTGSRCQPGGMLSPKSQSRRRFGVRGDPGGRRTAPNLQPLDCFAHYPMAEAETPTKVSGQFVDINSDTAAASAAAVLRRHSGDVKSFSSSMWLRIRYIDQHRRHARRLQNAQIGGALGAANRTSSYPSYARSKSWRARATGSSYRGFQARPRCC